MLLTNTAIRRPIFIIMFILALIVVGIKGYQQMPSELMPNVDLPFISVVTSYPGAGPNEIETLVTEPLEKACGSIGNLKNVTSSSQDSISVVSLEFELGTNVADAAADVRDKVSATKQELPKDVIEPTIYKADFSSLPVITIGLEGNITPKELRILADDVIKDQFAKVNGVSSVNINGGEEREISVSIDKNRLEAYGLNLMQVVTSIKNANLNVPAGSIKEGNRDYSVRTVGEFQNAEEIGDVRIYVPGKKDNPDSNVSLKDIATISDTVKESTVLARLNGKPSVVISVQKQSDANTVDVAEGVKAELERLRSRLPSGIKTIVASDQSIEVKDSLNDVNKSLLEGIILVVLIVFLFLHSARATFIVAIAIPTSLLATYGPINAYGFTLNFMTLLALSLVIGILVDDSIVILENIERHIRKRENPVDAAINGRTEIGFAAVSITLVDVVVFVPIAFMGGIVGQFFKSFGLTIATATMFSLLMSFTLTPMLASRWMKSQEDKERDEADMKTRSARGNAGPIDRLNLGFGKFFSAWERKFTALEHFYVGILTWALENRFLVIVIGLTSLLVIFGMATPLMSLPRFIIGGLTILLCLIAMAINKAKGVALIYALTITAILFVTSLPFGFEFMPTQDEGTYSVSIRCPAGTSLKATDAVVRQVEKIIAEQPEMTKVKYRESEGLFKSKTLKEKEGFYITTVGQSGQGGFGAGDNGPQFASISVTTLDKIARRELVHKLPGYKFRSIDEITTFVADKVAKIPGAEQISVGVSGGGGPGGGISEEISGQKMDEILKTAYQVADEVKSVPGAIDVDVSWKAGRPERRIIVDRLKASELGMTVSDIALIARVALDGDDTAKLREGGTEYPIRVRYGLGERSAASDVEKIIIGDKDGIPVYLSDVAKVVYDFAPTKIDRKNRQRVVYVKANLAEGAKLGNVQGLIDAKVAAIPKSAVSINKGGAGDLLAKSAKYMFEALFLAILFVYMLMAALFESLLTPFVIMFALPQALVGALFALLILGKSLSIVAMIGIIMLMGLVAKNAILLVDYTNTLRGRGKGRNDAIKEAGATRLKPILMTTTAMIGGMLPTALAVSRGSETRSPMASDVIGGLLFSLLLTLIVIPVVYTIVDDMWLGFTKRFWHSAYNRALEKQKEHLTQTHPEPYCEE